RPVMVAARDEDELTVRFSSPKAALDEEESQIVSWVLENRQEAGCGTGVFSGSPTCYRPVKTGQGIIGVIGFQAADPKEPLSPEQSDLLGILMNQIALAITR